MKEQNDYIFSIYKPLRNQIKNYNLLDSLYVIWCYSRNITSNHSFPTDIELRKSFDPNGDLTHKRYKGIPEFEQEFLLREFILHCEDYSTSLSLKQKDNLAKLINYLRFSFQDEIDRRFTIPGDFLLEFNRMAHRQFKWQINHIEIEIFRYYKIYASEKMNSIVTSKFGLSTYEIFVIGFFFYGWTSLNFQVSLPLKSDFGRITCKMIENFINYFSMTIEQAKTELKECQQMNENIFYSYNPIASKPLLIYQDKLICPMPILLFKQVTGGLYYSTVGANGFENAYGEAFQNYIGVVLQKSCNKSKFQILEEKKFGKQEKRTTDWILVDSKTVLFIECKTKRMTIASKSELDIRKGLERDIKKMASFITQIYKTYLDYKNGYYPHLVFDSTKQFIPLVVTMEPWYITLNPRIEEILHGNVIECFQTNKIDIQLLNSNPYHIHSSEEFEKNIQLINSLGIIDFFNVLNKKELYDFIDDFHFKNLFEGEFKKTFVDTLGK